jgi:hypothetical protein
MIERSSPPSNLLISLSLISGAALMITKKLVTLYKDRFERVRFKHQERLPANTNPPQGIDEKIRRGRCS